MRSGVEATALSEQADGNEEKRLIIPLIVDDAALLENFVRDEEITDEEVKIFIEEVLHGVLRYRSLIEATLTLFYFNSGAHYLRTEFYLFATLVYLTLFRLPELGFTEYSKFIRTCDPTKMSRLIAFLFDSTHITGGCLSKAWCEILDQKFVEDEIVVHLLEFAKQARKLTEQLVDVSRTGMVPKKAGRGVTEPEPFLLTRPNPRRVPEPSYSHSTLTKARPIPKSFYVGTGELEVLEKAKKESRTKQKKSQEEAEKHLFRVAKLEKKKRSLHESGEKQIKLQAPGSIRRQSKPKPPPDFSKDHISVKLTAAAILREDALVRKARKEELKVLHEVEMSLHDASEFNLWQEELRIKSEQEKRIEQEKRRLEIQLLHEEAVEAKLDMIREKQGKVKEIKEEASALKEIAEVSKKHVEEENRRKIDDIHEIQENVIRAKLKVTSEKQRKAADVSLESQVLKEKAQREAEEDRIRKAELIQQIRLLEKSILPVGSYVKTIDPTETSGLGLKQLQEKIASKKAARMASKTSSESTSRDSKESAGRQKQKSTVWGGTRSIRDVKSGIEQQRWSDLDILADDVLERKRRIRSTLQEDVERVKREAEFMVSSTS
ncbi:hypothetical protein HDU67_009880 [Dinochytrium kinnereticum]|nr:hypothetical protein HDU67_009880 [Dinochytrium kinnereticum]